jgi:hypothetical protein
VGHTCNPTYAGGQILRVQGQVYNLSPQEAETGSRIQVQLGLPSKFEASLGYIVRPDVKKKGRKEIQLM